jgi:hypothetical protein
MGKPGQTTCETMEWEISAMLEDAFGKDLWEGVEADMVKRAKQAKRMKAAKAAQKEQKREERQRELIK